MNRSNYEQQMKSIALTRTSLHEFRIPIQMVVLIEKNDLIDMKIIKLREKRSL